MAAIWCTGAMPLFGVKLTLLSVTIPVMLMAVGSAYGIHVISHYKDGMSRFQTTDRDLGAEEHRTLVLNLVRRLVKMNLDLGDFGFDDTEERPFEDARNVERVYDGKSGTAGGPAADQAKGPAPPASEETPVTFAMINSAIGKNQT